MTEQEKEDNPNKILDHTLNDDWMLLWYKALLLSDDYRDYCKAVKDINDIKDIKDINDINETEIDKLIGKYENIKETYEYWGDIYTVGGEIVNFENADDMYWDGWREDNSARVNQLTVNKAEIIQEGFPLEPQAGTLYFCQLSNTKHKPRIQTKSDAKRVLKEKAKQDADPELKKKEKDKQNLPSELEIKLQGYLGEAVKSIEKKLAKDRIKFSNKPISQLNPNVQSNQFDPTGRRLAAVYAINKHNQNHTPDSDLNVKDAFIELLQNPPTPTWKVRQSKFIINSVKSLEKLKVIMVRDEYDTFRDEYEEGLILIENALMMDFPNYKKSTG